MLSYYTNGINNPWTSKDIEDYERFGSQRDKIIYNSYYKSRLILTDENVFLYSSKHDSQYKNFYIWGVTRNLFYLMFYIPQLDFVHDSDIINNQIVKKCLSKLLLIKNASESVNGICHLNTDVSFSDGTFVLVKVNANIGELLFPKHKEITNIEILKKLSLMHKVYIGCIKQRDILIDALDKYRIESARIREIKKEKLQLLLFRKGVKLAMYSAMGIPPLDIFSDLDELFSLGEIAQIAEVTDFIDMADMMDTMQVDDLLDDSDVYA